jgi:hypothetical protein
MTLKGPWDKVGNPGLQLYVGCLHDVKGPLGQDVQPRVA